MIQALAPVMAATTSIDSMAAPYPNLMFPEGFLDQPHDEALVLRRAEEAKQTADPMLG